MPDTPQSPAAPAGPEPAPPAAQASELAAALAAARTAQDEARSRGLAYAGDLAPEHAWALVRAGRARLVDVRSAAELKFVGRVPGADHAAWAEGPQLQRNPDFEASLAPAAAQAAAQGQWLVLLCRSGVRSIRAAERATELGLPPAFNILEGFEGPIDPQRRRRGPQGWRHRGLPWEQD